MSESRQKNLGATPGKLAIVGVLSLVLVYVLFGDALFGGSKSQAKLRPRSAEQKNLGEPTTANAVTVVKPIEESIVRKDWPELELEKVVRFDPFGTKLPGDVKRAALAATGETSREDNVTLQEIQKADEAIVIVSGGEKIARYGTLELRVGDQVGGYRVMDINNQGVILTDQ